jgi:hypothetical protein
MQCNAVMQWDGCVHESLLCNTMISCEVTSASSPLDIAARVTLSLLTLPHVPSLRSSRMASALSREAVRNARGRVGKQVSGRRLLAASRESLCRPQAQGVHLPDHAKVSP